jgi:hypothetical protein
MECIIQYLDDLEDLFYAAALRFERIRRAIRILALAILTIALQVGTFVLALVQPPLALAVASLLLSACCTARPSTTRSEGAA